MREAEIKKPLQVIYAMAFSEIEFRLYYFYRIHRAYLSAGIAFDTEVGYHFMLFVWLEKDCFGWAFLGTFGAANT